MRINEAYEHESLLPYSGEEACPSSGCNRMGTQCVDVSALLTLTPVATAGTAVISCQGSPTVTCTTDAAGTACLVTVTQKVCVSVPIRYSVTVNPDEPTIACAAGAACTLCERA